MKELYAKKLDNNETDKFLESYNLQRLNQGEIEILNRPIMSNEIYLVIKNLLQTETPGPDGFTGKFY